MFKFQHSIIKRNTTNLKNFMVRYGNNISLRFERVYFISIMFIIYYRVLWKKSIVILFNIIILILNNIIKKNALTGTVFTSTTGNSIIRWKKLDFLFSFSLITSISLNASLSDQSTFGNWPFLCFLVN